MDEFIVDTSKPPIPPPLVTIRHSIFGAGETRKSKKLHEEWSYYIEKYGYELRKNDHESELPDSVEQTPINLNDRFSVILTDKGLDAYRQYYQGVAEMTNHPKKQDNTGVFDADIKRSDKNLTLQLWSLMEIFGVKMFMAGPTLFEQNQLTPAASN